MRISDIVFDAPVPAPASQPNPSEGASSLEDLFRSVAASCPENLALSGGGRSLSFAELDALSLRIAGFIRSRNYGDSPVVGVLCRRGALYLAAAIGAMRAGAVYLPAEGGLPESRQAIMLKPVRLIVTDRACLREAEHFSYMLPAVDDVLCLDAPDYNDALETETGLSSIAYWEQIAEAGSDQGWRSDFDQQPFPAETLAAMAAAVVEKCGLAQRANKRVLDIGSGSGAVASALAGTASHYTAVELARNELDRVAGLVPGTPVERFHMAAQDIGLLDGRTFDAIVLNGVVENFPGYNHLRKVLNAAVQRLSGDGVIVVGAVRDLDRRDDLRAALQAHAQTTGNHAGLLRLDSSTELFVPRRFFTKWAAESPVPVDVSFSPSAAGEGEGHRFDAVIRKGQPNAAPVRRRRFGERQLPPPSPEALSVCVPEQVAYIVYTSGSTGRPKGVVVEHRHLLHIIRALKDYAEGCERVALVAPLPFDASIQQLAVSLFCGKSLFVLSDEERKQPSLFYESVRANRIDLCDMTPAFFSVLVDYLVEHKRPLPVKRLLLAGEVLRPDTVRKFYGIPGNEGVVLFNVYGPTECTVDSSAFRIDHANHRSFPSYPIGRAMDGVVISIRDKTGQALPDSITGELWISGAGVSRGYLNGENPESFITTGEGRFYRTGDYGHTLNGLVFYRGREDQQVKIRGNRVEIGEVEKVVAGCPGVRQVVVVADTFRAEEGKSLAAYVVGTVDAASLRSYLERHLPPYCVPGYIVPMVELPLSVNRKVDKKSLPSPLGHADVATGRKPEGAVEETLAGFWKRLLGVDVADAEASFFSLGGHSILAIRLIAMIEKEMSLNISISDLFANPSIAAMARFFAGKTARHGSPVIQLCHCEGGKNLFLFHPVGGSVFCYSDLANLLKDRFTVFAVEAAGFSPEKTALNTELQSVESLAGYYLEEILKVVTEDIVFGGWSFGGVLAYETARQYDALGKSSGPVLILDTVADNRYAKKTALLSDAAMLKEVSQGAFVCDEDRLASLPRSERQAYLMECLEKTGLLPSGFNPARMDNLLQTYRCNAIAAARYDNPAPSDKDVLFIRALDYANNAHIIDGLYQGWNRFLPENRISLRWTEGTHTSMLSPGFVGQVAKHILEYLT
jgi:amino acid adenylation domain-containing protein